MSFLRHGEIYRSDVGPTRSDSLAWPLPALIGCDEFPVGYSSAGCSPAEPASASPTGDDCLLTTLEGNYFFLPPQPPAWEQYSVHPYGKMDCLTLGFTCRKQPHGIKKLSQLRGAPQWSTDTYGYPSDNRG
jgi:hypothetical protein